MKTLIAFAALAAFAMPVGTETQGGGTKNPQLVLRTVRLVVHAGSEEYV